MTSSSFQESKSSPRPNPLEELKKEFQERFNDIEITSTILDQLKNLAMIISAGGSAVRIGQFRRLLYTPIIVADLKKKFGPYYEIIKDLQEIKDQIIKAAIADSQEKFKEEMGGLLIRKIWQDEFLSRISEAKLTPEIEGRLIKLYEARNQGQKDVATNLKKEIIKILCLKEIEVIKGAGVTEEIQQQIERLAENAEIHADFQKEWNQLGFLAYKNKHYNLLIKPEFSDIPRTSEINTLLTDIARADLDEESQKVQELSQKLKILLLAEKMKLENKMGEAKEDPSKLIEIFAAKKIELSELTNKIAFLTGRIEQLKAFKLKQFSLASPAQKRVNRGSESQIVRSTKKMRSYEGNFKAKESKDKQSSSVIATKLDSARGKKIVDLRTIANEFEEKIKELKVCETRKAQCLVEYQQVEQQISALSKNKKGAQDLSAIHNPTPPQEQSNADEKENVSKFKNGFGGMS